MHKQSLIVAHDRNNVIGLNSDLPWRDRLPADLQRFKRLTIGQTVVMGRRTFDSIGRPLPERKNIVISRDRQLEIPGVMVVHSIDEALEVDVEGDELFIAGGATIYSIALPYINRMYITKIEAEFIGDTFFVEIDDKEWNKIDQEFRAADERNVYSMEFATYDRI